MLDAALRALATGDPGAVVGQPDRQGRSAPPGARSSTSSATSTGSGRPCCTAPPSAGARSAVRAIADRQVPPPAPLRERVVRDHRHCSTTASAPPIPGRSRTLRAALPRDGVELERLYPQTAAELQSWGRSWIAGLPERRSRTSTSIPTGSREVASFIPGAMRGIVSERQLGSLLRPRPRPAWADQRDRRVPRGFPAPLARRLCGKSSIRSAVFDRKPHSRPCPTSTGERPISRSTLWRPHDRGRRRNRRRR